MSHTIHWQKPGETIRLNLAGNLNRQELKDINQEMNILLQSGPNPLKVILDVTGLEADYTIADNLRDTQTYMNDGKVELVLIVTRNKLNHLIMLIAFSICRAHCVYFSTLEQANHFLQQRFHRLK